MHAFHSSQEWELRGFPGLREERFYDSPDPYVYLTFKLLIRRKTFYYFTNLIAPCVLIGALL